jgi:hypothetical protein
MRKGVKISDKGVRDMLDNIAGHFNSDVDAISGDRDYVPEGGSKKSHHLDHRAADFHVKGMKDGDAFAKLKDSGMLNSGYQVIWHQEGTATQGEHLHIGRYVNPSRPSEFKTETRGRDGRPIYTNVE